MEAIRTWLNGPREYTSGVKLYAQYGDDLALKRMFSEPQSDFKRRKLIQVLESIWQGRKQAKIPASPVPQVKPPATTPAFKIKRELVKSKNEVSQLTNVLHDTQQKLEEVADQLEDLEWEKETLEDENQELKEKLKSIKSRSGWPVEMDEAISALHSQWKPKFLEMCDLMSRIYEVGKEGLKNKSKEKEAGRMALRILDLRDQVISIYADRDHYLVSGRLREKPSPVEDCLDPNLWPQKLQNAQRYVREYRGKLSSMEDTNEKYLAALEKLQYWQSEVEKYKKLLKKD